MPSADRGHEAGCAPRELGQGVECMRRQVHCGMAPARTRQAALSPYHVGLGVGNDASGVTEHRLAMGTPIMCNEAGLLDAHACTWPSRTTDNQRRQLRERESEGVNIRALTLPWTCPAHLDNAFSGNHRQEKVASNH